MENQEMEGKVGKLDWGIIFSCIIMLLIVYIPSHIWREEVKFREESRKRMEVIADAEEFYKELTGEYTTDGLELFELVESALDSTIADSIFLGEQFIYFDNKSFKVNMSKGFKFRADTTFSDGVSLKRTIKDTIYTIGLINEETGNIEFHFGDGFLGNVPTLSVQKFPFCLLITLSHRICLLLYFCLVALFQL